MTGVVLSFAGFLGVPLLMLRQTTAELRRAEEIARRR
jgi:hypothetical protein